jgi:hypothetical protein
MHKAISAETKIETPTYMEEKVMWLKYLRLVLGRYGKWKELTNSLTSSADL